MGTGLDGVPGRLQVLTAPAGWQAAKLHFGEGAARSTVFLHNQREESQEKPQGGSKPVQALGPGAAEHSPALLHSPGAWGLSVVCGSQSQKGPLCMFILASGSGGFSGLGCPGHLDQAHGQPPSFRPLPPGQGHSATPRTLQCCHAKGRHCAGPGLRGPGIAFLGRASHQSSF